MELFKRYSFWSGLILVFVGLILYWILGVWGAAPLVPLFLGAGLVIAGAVLNWDNLQDLFSRQTTQYGMSSLAGTLIVLALLVLVNLVLSNFSYRTDTTAAGQYSLADQTVSVLKNLEQPVEVKAFLTQGNRRYVEDQLTEYAHHSSRFDWEIVDPDKRPEVAEAYNIRSLGQLVVEAGNRRETIDDYSEQNLTNAVIKVTRQETKTVYFTTGHGEHEISDDAESGLQQAVSAIENQNYVAKDLFLAGEDSIPGDASVVVIPGVQTELLEKEITMLTEYIENGGNVLFLLDPPPALGLSDFLANYYFEVGENIVVDMSGVGQLFGAGPTVPLVNNYGGHPITENFGVMTFFPLVRSVDVNLPSGATGYNGTVIARTNQRSWGETNIQRIRTESRANQDDEDLPGPVPIAAAMEVPSGGSPGNSRLVVFGDSDFATNRYFNSQGNGDLFMNSINWLLQDEDLISVRPKSPEDRRVNMSQSQVASVRILVVILLPILLLGAGGVVYWKRR